MFGKLGAGWGCTACSTFVSAVVAPVLSAWAGLAVSGCAGLQGVLGVDGFKLSLSASGNSGALSDPGISVSLPWAVTSWEWASEVLGLGKGAVVDS